MIPLLRGSDFALGLFSLESVEENISSTEALIYINHTHVLCVYIYMSTHTYYFYPVTLDDQFLCGCPRSPGGTTGAMVQGSENDTWVGNG